MKKILIGIPHQSEYIHTKFVNSLIDMQRDDYEHTIKVIKGEKRSGQHYKAYIKQEYRKLPDIARSNIVTAAMKHNCDYILFLDSDMVFQPTLLNDLLKHNKDIVGSLTWHRRFPYHPSIYRYNPKKKKGLHGDWDSILYPEVQLPMINKKNPKKLKGLIEVDAIGMAATLIKMKVFEKLNPPFFRFKREGGEDLSFCKRCKDKGFKIYCDTSTRVGHITNTIIDFKDIAMYTKHRAFITQFDIKNESRFS